jgi:rod shape determining protein RodA
MRIPNKALIASVALLSLVGVVAVYSSTRDQVGASLAVRQLVWMGLGVVAITGAAMIRVKSLSVLAPALYAAAVVMLVLVLLVGKGPYGTRRWFDLGFIRFQPSEFAKIAVILMLSRYLAERGRLSQSLRSILAAFAIAGVPALLVLYEPDLGTSLIIAFMAVPMLYAAGLDPLYLLFLISPFLAVVCAGEIIAWVVFVALLVAVMVLRKFRTSLVALVFGINFLLYSLAPRLWASLEPYQRDRVLAFLNPTSYRHGAGFQIFQSQIAIGSGGVTGKHLFQGTQKALGLVPAQHTDFIFSLIGEELGFLGSAAVLLLMLMIVVRIYGVAGRVRSRFSSLMCFGFGTLVLVQIFVNIGMTMGITPVTGLPLPFVSYGGSQMIVFWGMTGAVLSAYLSRREY